MSLALMGQLRVAQTMPAGSAFGEVICSCGRRHPEGERCVCLRERREQKRNSKGRRADSRPSAPAARPEPHCGEKDQRSRLWHSVRPEWDFRRRLLLPYGARYATKDCAGAAGPSAPGIQEPLTRDR